MARRLFILPVLLIFATTTAAQTLDKGKLRKAAYLPYLALGLYLEVRDVDEDGRKFPAHRIEKLTKRLCGAVEDAGILLEMAEAYHKAEEHAKQKESLAKAARLLEPHIQGTDPNSGHLLAWYARYLFWSFPEKLAEAEQLARRAVELSPKDWRCWEMLGWCVAQPAFVALAKNAAENHNWDEFTDKIPQTNVLPLRNQIPWSQVKRRLDEASACFKKARELAADNVDSMNAHVNFRFWEHPCRVAFEQITGQPAKLPRDARGMPDVLELQQQLAGRFPGNLCYQADLLATLMSAAFLEHKPSDGYSPAMTAQQRKQCTEYVQRLERAAEQGGQDVAANVHTFLAMFNAAVGDKDAFYRHGRRVVEIGPIVEDLWIYQAAMLKDEEKRGVEAIAFAQSAIRKKTTPRGCFGMAHLFGADNPTKLRRRSGADLKWTRMTRCVNWDSRPFCFGAVNWRRPVKGSPR